jgi:hypothetical protein
MTNDGIGRRDLLRGTVAAGGGVATNIPNNGTGGVLGPNSWRGFARFLDQGQYD